MEIVITANAKGSQTRKIRVQTNDSKAPQGELSCIAVAKCALQIDTQMVSFGDIKRSAEAQTKVVTIKRGDGGPIKPKVSSTGSDRVSAEIREIQEGEEYELAIKVSPPWPNGMLRSSIVLETGLAEAPTENLPINARIAARLTINPSRYSIPTKRDKDMEVRAVLAWSEDRPPGKITEIQCSDPKLTVELLDQEPRPVVSLHVPADYEFPANTRAFVTVKTDDPDALSNEIPIYPIRATPSSGPTTAPAVRVKPGAAGPRATAPEPPPPTAAEQQAVDKQEPEKK